MADTSSISFDFGHNLIQRTVSASLPSPTLNQTYCNVSVIEAGTVELPLQWILDIAQPGERIELPALSFLLRRPGMDENFLFDLGIRKDWQNITPTTAERLTKMQFKVTVDQDVGEGLARGGLQPTDVTHVCISHAHFDHIGDTRPYVNATFLVGAGTRAVVENGYPTNPDASIPADLLPDGRTRYLDSAGWPSLGPFEHALDFWGDGSLYIVDAGDGHLPGHVNVLARTSADGGWVYLAGDSAHDRRLLTGEAKIAHSAFGCAHLDKEKAEAHLASMKALMKAEPRARVLLAHDQPWWQQNKDKDAFWPNKLPSL